MNKEAPPWLVLTEENFGFSGVFKTLSEYMKLHEKMQFLNRKIHKTSAPYGQPSEPLVRKGFKIQGHITRKKYETQN